jgi:chromosome segregation ATPase
MGSTGAAATELRRLLNERWYSVAIGRGQPRTYSANGVLSEIRRRYDAVRSAVADIDHLWVSILPRVDAARATLARLQAEVDELGVPEPLVGRARALAEDLAERLIEDPASVHPQDGANLDLQVAEAAKMVATLRTKHDDLDIDLASTEELLASLRVLRARAEAARREATAKVAGADGLVRVPGEAVLDGPDGLAARLDQLFDDAAGGNWSRKRSLLDSWLDSARRLEAQLIRAGETNRAPVEARDELRGRLRAYNAKMAATGRAEDLALVEVADQARGLLYTAPTDLDAAEAAIADLAARLRQ